MPGLAPHPRGIYRRDDPRFPGYACFRLWSSTGELVADTRVLERFATPDFIDGRWEFLDAIDPVEPLRLVL